MKRLLLAATLLMPVAAFAADNAVIVTPGAGVTMRSRDTTGAGGPQSMITILGDTGGNPSGVFANYGTSPGAVLVPAFNAFITNIPAVSQSGNWIARVVGNAGATLDATVGAGAAPTNALAVGAIFNSTPITVANTQFAALQSDANGFLKVNIAAGAAAGGTSSTFGASFPTIGTAIGAKNGANMVNLVADGSGNLNVNVATANTNGQKTMANSSPVVIASDQATFPVSPFTINNVVSQGHICGNTARVHVTTNTDTQIIAQSGTTTIYICDYEFQFTGVGAFFLEKATTGTCATLTQIGQVWTGTSGTPIGKAAGNAYYRGLNTGASAQLCANTTALSSSALDITVYYDQY